MWGLEGDLNCWHAHKLEDWLSLVCFIGNISLNRQWPRIFPLFRLNEIPVTLSHELGRHPVLETCSHFILVFLSDVSERYINWCVLCFQFSMSCAPCLWGRGGSPACSFANTVPICGTLESASSYKTVPSSSCVSYWWPITKFSTRCWCSLR